MTLTIISDTHGYHDQLHLANYPADTLIHAGDFTNNTSNQEADVRRFLEWFSSQPYDHRILIAGNHELYIESNPIWFAELLANYPNITYLHDTSVTIDGINFYGSPRSNEFCNWAFMSHELELADTWQHIPNETNVLITHGPAYGHLDKIVRSYGGDSHVGSQSLTRRKRHLPDLVLHVCGHIHEDHGSLEVDTHTVINASVLNEKYQLTNQPTIYQL